MLMFLGGVIGGLVGGASKMLGGFLGSKVGSSIAGSAGSAIGGALDRQFDAQAQRSAQSHAARQQNLSEAHSQRQFEKSLGFQREFNQKAIDATRRENRLLREERNRFIRQRTYDAKQAGLHPLFALGGSLNQSSQAFIPGQSPSGSSTGTAIAASVPSTSRFSRLGSAFDARKQLERDRLREMRSDRMAVEAHHSSLLNDEAMRGYYHSLAAKASQEATQGPSATAAEVISDPEIAKATIPNVVVPTPVQRPYVYAKRPDGTFYRAYTEDASGLQEFAPVATATGVVSDFLSDAYGLFRMKRDRKRPFHVRERRRIQARKRRYIRERNRR